MWKDVVPGLAGEQANNPGNSKRVFEYRKAFIAYFYENSNFTHCPQQLLHHVNITEHDVHV